MRGSDVAGAIRGTYESLLDKSLVKILVTQGRMQGILPRLCTEVSKLYGFFWW